MQWDWLQLLVTISQSGGRQLVTNQQKIVQILLNCFRFSSIPRARVRSLPTAWVMPLLLVVPRCPALKSGTSAIPTKMALSASMISARSALYMFKNVLFVIQTIRFLLSRGRLYLLQYFKNLTKLCILLWRPGLVMNEYWALFVNFE